MERVGSSSKGIAVFIPVSHRRHQIRGFSFFEAKVTVELSVSASWKCNFNSERL